MFINQHGSLCDPTYAINKVIIESIEISDILNSMRFRDWFHRQTAKVLFFSVLDQD